MNAMNQNNMKQGYGRAAVFVGLVPLVLFPIFVFIPLLSGALSLFAVLLGALSLHTASHKSGVVGLVLGIIGFAYLVILMIGAMAASY